jgi:AcrR family transcriptional regulator
VTERSRPPHPTDGEAVPSQNGTKTVPRDADAKRKRLSPEERRKDIIKNATAFFAERGFAASTRELARELGVTQPLLYRYFPSKGGLIDEVYRTVYLNRWQLEWDALLVDRQRPIRERLQDFYEAYTDAIFTREWIRIYLFSGLKGTEINKRYVEMVEQRVLRRIIAEYRHEASLPAQDDPQRAELELAWVLHGGIFYYGVRKYIYGGPVLEQKTRFIANALDVFLAGLGEVFGTGVRVRGTTARRVTAPLPDHTREK